LDVVADRQAEPVQPFTGQPVADLAEICDWQARRQARRFAEFLSQSN
jgi:hypothetical protein